MMKNMAVTGYLKAQHLQNTSNSSGIALRYCHVRHFMQNHWHLIIRYTGKRLSFDSELPDDMKQVIEKWRTYISGRDMGIGCKNFTRYPPAPPPPKLPPAETAEATSAASRQSSADHRRSLPSCLGVNGRRNPAFPSAARMAVRQW